MSRVVTLSMEEAEQLHHLLTADDHLFIESFRSEKRVREVRAWRSLLRHTLLEMGYEAEARAKIDYTPIGAPYIVDSEVCISISHAIDRVAIVVSDSRCAIDVESINRDFTRAAKRYCSDAEHALLVDAGVDQ